MQRCWRTPRRSESTSRFWTTRSRSSVRCCGAHDRCTMHLLASSSRTANKHCLSQTVEATVEAG